MFYVYSHRKITSGEVFYIGKGCGKRFRDINNRNLHWRNTVKTHGFIPEIICKTEDEDFSLSIELFLITSFKFFGVKLVNILSGGLSNSGPRHSEEFKKRKSVMMTGVKRDESFCKKLSESLRGIPKTAEHKKKLSEAKKGTKVPSAWKKIRCITTGDVFQSLTEAASFTGLDASHISKCCYGKIKAIRGMSFEYIVLGS